uniref:C2H2-type domain-containing protein n=1 Tax=Ditylenchus dipsaci TaxID=166011 RepID=A0A915DN63_9BILA
MVSPEIDQSKQQIRKCIEKCIQQCFPSYSASTLQPMDLTSFTFVQQSGSTSQSPGSNMADETRSIDSSCADSYVESTTEVKPPKVVGHSEVEKVALDADHQCKDAPPTIAELKLNLAEIKAVQIKADIAEPAIHPPQPLEQQSPVDHGKSSMKEGEKRKSKQDNDHKPKAKKSFPSQTDARRASQFRRSVSRSIVREPNKPHPSNNSKKEAGAQPRTALRLHINSHLKYPLYTCRKCHRDFYAQQSQALHHTLSVMGVGKKLLIDRADRHWCKLGEHLTRFFQMPKLRLTLEEKDLYTKPKHKNIILLEK